LKPAANSVLKVFVPHGTRRSLTVMGVVHDPSLAPAWQEQTVYGYVMPATLGFLGEDPSLPACGPVMASASSGARPHERRMPARGSSW